LRYAHELLVLLACLSLILLTQTVGAVTSYSVTVSVQGLPVGVSTTLYIDGGSNGTLGSGKSVTVNFGSSGLSHVLAVDYYVPNNGGDKGTRYSTNSPSWSFSGPGSHTFIYSTQYLLTIQTAYSSAGGGGWYDAGSTVQAVLKNGQVDEGQGTRLMFTGWTGDASGLNLTSNKIAIDSPKTAIASWKTQFLLTINSDPPSIGLEFHGGGWYDSGTQATFSSPSAINAAEDSRLRFSSWTGDYSGQLSSGTVIIDRPKVVTAHFLAQYLVTIQYDPPSIASHYNETRAGWYDAGSSVQLGPVPPLVDLSSVERLRFSNWVNNRQMNANFSLRVTLDKPRKIALTYVTQYYVDVKTSHGSVSGSGWYDKGATAKITEVADASWPVSYTVAGWNLNPSGRLVKGDVSWSLSVDRPYVVEARWDVDYLPLIVLIGGVSAAVVILVAGVILVRRRRIFRGAKIVSGGQICKSCGSMIPEGAIFCQKCGTSIDTVPPPETSVDDKVYDYIIKHEGVISLSKAASDLGITVEKVKEIAERLKTDGKLS
jgi:hypothetical protein